MSKKQEKTYPYATVYGHLSDVPLGKLFDEKVLDLQESLKLKKMSDILEPKGDFPQYLRQAVEIEEELKIKGCQAEFMYKDNGWIDVEKSGTTPILSFYPNCRGKHSYRKIKGKGFAICDLESAEELFLKSLLILRYHQHKLQVK